jgi:hypothetical protein
MNSKEIGTHLYKITIRGRESFLISDSNEHRLQVTNKLLGTPLDLGNIFLAYSAIHFYSKNNDVTIGFSKKILGRGHAPHRALKTGRSW